MDQKSYRALWVCEEENGSFSCSVTEREINQLPDNEVLIRVHYSSLNYKDALSITGNKGITKTYPHQPGIDAVGSVVSSSNPNYKAGDMVLCTGYDLGMNTAGGLGQYIRIPASWVVSLPSSLTEWQSMALGTAGFTAALGLYLLERNGQKPNQGPIVVTGATGGVGCLAVSILAKAGYEVIASTGKEKSHSEWLRKMGASKVVDRSFVDLNTNKQLLSSKWAGAIDTVGGNTLSTLLKACKPYGNVANCGLVQSPFFDTSVFPFIINGISLLGIASAENPIEMKQMIWKKLSNEWKISQWDLFANTISLEQVNQQVEQMLQGQIIGRKVVNLKDA